MVDKDLAGATASPNGESRPTKIGHSLSETMSASDGIGPVAVVLLLDIRPSDRLWGYANFLVGKWLFRGVPGLLFCKVLGSGHGGGFGLKPSASRQARFCLFADDASADVFIASARVRDAASRCSEFLSAKLRAYSSKGSWSGTKIAVTATSPDDGPIVALTRASIRPSRAWRFWRMQPPSEQALQNATGCLLATGVGEAPFLRQATITLWQDTQSMDAYARSGAHLAAIRAAYEGNFFSESMFVRFCPSKVLGCWRGRVYG